MAEGLAFTVFSASLENEAALRNWLVETRRLVDDVERAVEALSEHLRERVHVQITLIRHPSKGDTTDAT